MPRIEEVPPIMVLTERSAERLVFRFRNRQWAGGTLLLGVVLLGVMSYFQFSRNLPLMPWAVVYAFGLLLLYSSVYSFTANQFLVVKGRECSIRFHKHNLYGKVDWVRSGDEFAEIQVFKPLISRGRAKNWAIVLVGRDGLKLFLGENEFGSLHREGAVALAENLGRLAGIRVSAAGTE